MDHPLPTPDPDWDNPEPSDAPEAEETDAIVGLVKLRDGLTAWLTMAAGNSLPPVKYRQLIALLNAAAEQVRPADSDPIATYVPAQIVIHPHFAVDQNGWCARCNLPATDGVHRRPAELTGEPRPEKD